MSIASDLLERHIQTLVADPAQWQTLIADDMVWELAYAPAIGHPARLAGRDEIMHHVIWFLSAVENFRFIEPRISAFANPLEAVVQVKAEALIKPTRRVYRQEYVMFLFAKDGKIAHMREYFDPTRAARSMNESILDLSRGFDRRCSGQVATHPVDKPCVEDFLDLCAFLHRPRLSCAR